MLDLARCNAEVAGVRHRILFDRADAKALPYDNDRFDAVVSNSIVHHIPEPLAVLKEGWRVLRRGGLMFVRDLLRPADEEQLQHLVATYAGDATDHQRQLFAHSLRAALTLDEVRELVGQLPCEPAGVTQTSDRHWTWAARK
jgi:ubiquinone/menaquinone biosynthesis C-methylase UbiE